MLPCSVNPVLQNKRQIAHHAWGSQAMQAAVGEKLLISKADYFVMSRTSGFARQPAVQVRHQKTLSMYCMLLSSEFQPRLQARRWSSLFVVWGAERNCSAFHADPLSVVALYPPGL